jgi:hypothetical protein
MSRGVFEISSRLQKSPLDFDLTYTIAHSTPNRGICFFLSILGMGLHFNSVGYFIFVACGPWVKVEGGCNMYIL